LLLATLVVLLAWLPPESHGAAQAGAAALLLLLAALHWRAAGGRVTAQASLATCLGGGMALAWTGQAPSAAVEPLAIGALAAVAGLALASADGGPRLARALILALLAAATGVALFALWQALGGLERWGAAVAADPSFPDRAAALARLSAGRAFAGFATPAALGGFLCLALPVAVSHMRSGTLAARRVAAAVSLLLAGALLASASATAVAALLAAVLWAGLLWHGGRRRWLAPGLLVLLLLMAGVVALRGGRVTDPGVEDGPWRLRAGNLRAAAAIAADHPWSGVGPGAFAEVYPSYRRAGDNETRHAHHLPVELVAEWGWPAGLALGLMFFALFVGPLWTERAAPPWRRGLAVGLAAFALQNLADFTAFLPSLLWTAALLRGLLQGPASPLPPAVSATRALAGANLAAAATAAVALALGGLAADARVEARAAAFDGDRRAALTAAERAAGLAPWDPDAALLAARLSVDLGGSDALARAERAVSLAPIRATAREARARARLSVGDAPGAYADLREATRLHPVHAGYRAARDDLGARLARRDGP
jgi:hypothetical protein